MARNLASKTFWHPPPADDDDADGDDAQAGRRTAWRRWLGGLDRSAATAALSYALFGVAWIVWSDRLLFGLSSDLTVLRWLGEWKGLVFVALSAFWVGMTVCDDQSAPNPGASKVNTVSLPQVPGGPNPIPPPDAHVRAETTSDGRVVVRMFDPTGAPNTYAFNLIVAC